MQSLSIGSDNSNAVQVIGRQSCDDDIGVLFIAFSDDGPIELNQVF